MRAMKPEDCDYLLAEAINKGDADSAAGMYEADAVFVAEPGKNVQGMSGLRELMQGMVADKPSLTIHVPTVVQSGDLALLFSEYTARTTKADGSVTEASGKGREVVRRQADGSWKFVIDHPTGGM